MHTLAQLRSGELAGLRRLDLSCGLASFPAEIFSLADSLEVLNLSGNQLDSLPDDLHRLTKLRVLFCSDNRFTRLPEALGRCAELELVGFKANRIEDVPAAALPPRLRWLILTDNAIAGLPAELGRRPRLQKLMLAGNRLAALPAELAACGGLELLRIAANRIVSLPGWLLAMPRLSWLAVSGNPCCADPEADLGVETVAWSRLSLQQPPLGEGASGVIHPALWASGAGANIPVAVKLFKGAVTSDGSPASEMAACLAAGRHSHLVGPLGVLAGHPAGTAGLVMDRIDPRFRNLAGPPSLASCTRDVYPPQTRFTAEVAWRLASGIAAAVAHLHSRGVMHGDLYAHNILWRDDGHALLGDFGAASRLPVGGTSESLALQRMEVRAFGYLLEELGERCEPAASSRLFAPLQADCLSADAGARPLFAGIVQRLQEMAGRFG